MVEVFKTNVQHQDHAKLLIDRIHQNFGVYKANFDLEDCDHILRVKCASGIIDASTVINILKGFGFYAEVLADQPPDNLSEAPAELGGICR